MHAETKQTPTIRTELKKEIFWACACTALFFIFGAVVGFITGGDDHFRGGKMEFSKIEWQQIRQEQWASLWITGLYALPFGLGFYGLVFLLRALWSRFRSNPEE